ncbi:MAG: hypothetical protein ABH850_00735 [Candidatus Micrarchaeota archaeon]
MEKMLSTKFSFSEKTVLIKTNSKKMHKILEVFLPEFGSGKKEDLILEYFFFEENSDMDFRIMKEQFVLLKKLKMKSKDKIVFESEKGKKGKMIISGFLDLKKKHGKIKLRMKSDSFWRFFVFNLAQCLAFYLSSHNGAVIHSSALAENGKGFLFPAGDEQGKTTFLFLCPKTVNLAEDLNFLFRKEKKFFIQAFPFMMMLANITKKKAKKFELKTVLFLAKSKKLKLKKLTKREAVIKLLENDVNAMFGFQEIKFKERISFYSELFSHVPAFVLYFPLRENLWKEVKKKLNKTLDLK